MKRIVRYALVALAALAGQEAYAVVAEPVRNQQAVYDAAANTVTVSAKAPKYTEYDWETYIQETLTHIDYVLVERHIPGKEWPTPAEVARVTDVTPGEVFTWTDTDVKPDAKYEYRLSCYVDGTRGSSSYCNVYCGVVPGELGAFTATVPDWETSAFDLTVTAPTTDDKGNALTIPVNVRVEYLNTMTWYEVYTFENMEPGATKSIRVTEGVVPEHTYNLRAYAIAGTTGNGPSSEAQVYVGEDIPVSPENVEITSDQSSVTLTWDIPERGERGGCVNPDNVVYNIYVKYAGDESFTLIKERNIGERYVHPIDFTEETVLQFAISSVNTIGESFKRTETEKICAGPYASYPFTESFGGGNFNHRSWVATGYDDGYYQHEIFGTYANQTEYFLRDDINITINPVDEDGGLLAATFYSYIKEGDSFTITSPRIDFSSAQDPAVSIWYYYIPVTVENSEHVLRILVSAEGGEYEEVGTTASQATMDDHGWRQLCVRAPQLAGKAYGNVRFEVVHGLWSTDLSMDNIHVDEYELAGIATPDADDADAPVEWYNLQGIRVNQPAEGGIYIKKQGSKTEKVLVK